MSVYHHMGKQVLHDGQHFADARDPEAAAQIAAALGDRSRIAAYLDAEADKRRSAGLRLGFRVLAQNVRAGLHEELGDDRA